MAKNIPLLVIGGPTASGKSEVAVELALRNKGAVVSADSMQVYKFMDIGTAKVSKETRNRVPHYMLDVVEPHEDYSLAQYKTAAVKCIQDIWQQGKLPILAGGTGLYIKAVIENYPLEEMPHDPLCRGELNTLWDRRGQDYMVELLEKVDPESAAKYSDRRRIIRALEVYQLAGRAFSVIQREAQENNPFKSLNFALTLPREKLYGVIDLRAEQMVIKGLIGEYINLINRGYPADCKAMQGLGYRHSGMFVQGKWTKAEMVEQLQQDTRRFAKRQLTWFRGMKDIIWQDNSNPLASVEIIDNKLQELLNSPAK